ncbi:MAG: AmmeMemoRadiSam system protein B [Candidatus Brocadiia bacterium]
MPVRKAVFASDHGFYPASRAALTRMLEELVRPSPEASPALAVVAPHAGYVFSGGVAGAVYSKVVVPDDVVVLSVNHGRSPGAEFALFDEGTWQTPLGDVPIATELVSAISAECPMVEADPQAHAAEHSGEVHVPFLQYRNAGVHLAPICIMQSSLERLRQFGEGLARAADRLGRPVLLVASTDMTHFEPHEAAREKDHLVIEKILDLDEEGMWDAVRRHRVSMCGHDPVAAGIVYARARGAGGAELVDYKTSGDTPYAGRDQVVGYAGIVIR